MTTATNSKVDNFINQLNLPVEVATVLFKSDKDCHEFSENFYNRNKYVIDDLLDFREYKIDNSNVTLGLFLKDCNINMKKAFENTFFQSFLNDEIEFISNAVNRNKITLEQLFNNFQKNSEKNIMRYVL